MVANCVLKWARSRSSKLIKENNYWKDVTLQIVDCHKIKTRYAVSMLSNFRLRSSC